MAQIIDLDELLGDDKHVRLASVTYTLPPDLPVELYLKITKFGQNGDASDTDMVEALYNELLGLFRYKQPDLEKLPVTMSQLVGAIGRIYGAEQEQEEESAPRPPARKASGGATKTGSRSQTKSRSRR